MDYKCLKSIAQQILFCYGRNLAEPIPLYLGLCELSKESNILYNLRKQTGFDNWKIRTSESNCVEMFKDSLKIVYLSADSKNVLDRLEIGTCYVIGGIVDRNKYKGLCEGKAKDLGIETARFPLLENIKLTSSCVLASNHCFDIIHEIKNDKSWRDALESVIPQRKRETNEKIDE
jgi:tRNA (guanine9-N1)-methyltransferase